MMLKLGSEQQERAEGFVYGHARPLEQHLFSYYLAMFPLTHVLFRGRLVHREMQIWKSTLHAISTEIFLTMTLA